MKEVTGTIEVPMDCSIFTPQVDPTSIDRVEEIQTLNLYLNDNQVVYIDGPKNIGKTTILSQFLNGNQRHSIAIFLNESNARSITDKDIYKDLYIQIRMFTAEYTSSDLDKDVKLSDLIKIFRILSYYLTMNKKHLFFILDGFENLEGSDSTFLDDLLFNLPQHKQIKFLISISSDNDFKSKMVFKNSIAFSVPVLSGSHIKQMLPDAKEDEIISIITSFHGKPDSVSIIARLVKQGVSIQEILLNPSQESDALYDAEWDFTITNDHQKELVGFLAFSNQTLNIKNLSLCCDKSELEIAKIIKSIAFIQLKEEEVDFVSFGYKKYGRIKLKENKINCLEKIIHLIKKQKVTSNPTDLTLYLKDKGDNKEILEHLNKVFLLDLFKNTHSINDLQKNVSIGLTSSIEVKNNSKAIKYSHIKCAFSNINTSYLLVNELKCYLTDNNFTSAISLIESSKSNEEKLQLYSVYCIHFKEQKIEIEEDVKAKIEHLFNQINIKNLGDEKTIDIAIDLFPVFPKKAMKLINGLDSSNSSGQNKSDHAFLKLSMETLKRHGTSFSDDLEEFDGLEDKKAKMFETIQIFNPDSPINTVIEYIDKITEAGDKIFLIRAWLTRFSKKKDAILLLEKVIDLIISTTTFSSDASLYFDISHCLTNSFSDDSQTKIKKQSYERIISQLESIKSKGPTLKYCQLVLIIIKFEIINNFSNERINELIQYISTINDKSISLACLSIITKFLNDENLQLSNIDIEIEKESLVNQLLISDAYQVDVFRDALVFEAKNNLLTAIAWSQKLNTEPRRDKAKSIAIKSYCASMDKDNMPVPLSTLLEHIRYIKDEHYKVDVYKALVKNITKLDLSKGDFTKVFKVIKRIEHRRLKAKCLTDVARISIEKGTYNEVPVDILQKIDESLLLIDGDWNKINTAFYIYERLSKFDRNAALKFKELAIKLRTRSPINNQHVVEYLYSSISLSIRSLFILAKYKIDDQNSFELVINAIKKIPSNALKTKLFSILTSAYQKNSNVEKPKIIIEDYIIPLLDEYPVQPSAEYNYCSSWALPILALYKTSIYEKYLHKIGPKNKYFKDKVITNTIEYYYRDCLVGDPFETVKNHKYDIVFSDFQDIIKLISLLSDDSSTIFEIQTLLEIIASSRKNCKLTATQQNDLVSDIKITFENAFPRSNYISHEGYKILFSALIEKYSRSNKDSWLKIIDEARKIPNISDRSFTLLEISKHITGISTELQKTLIKESDQLIDSLTSNLEKVNRYSRLCENAKKIDKKIASEAIRKALRISGTNDIDEFNNARLGAIDMAYKLGDSFASSLVNTFDDDPARKESIQNEIAERKKEDDYKKKFEKNLDIDSEESNNSIYRLAWRQLGSLNANSCHTSKGFDITKYIQNGIPLTLEQFYMLLSFYTHYLDKTSPGKENARANVLPIFEEIIQNISIVLDIYSNSNEIGNDVQSNKIDSSNHIMINEGEITLATNFIKEWYSANKGEKLTIIDPYFSLEDLCVIGDVIDKDPEVNIKILTSKDSLKNILKHSSNDFEDIVAEYWNESISTSSLPSIEFVFVNYGSQDQLPIHDRWWLTDNSAIHTGTSVNGFAQRISQISVLDLEGKLRVLELVDPFLQMKQKVYQDQRVKYQSYMP